MDQEKITLSRIISGFLKFNFNNDQILYLVYPSLNVKYEAELYAKDLYDNHKFNDWIQEEDILSILLDNSLWTVNHERNLFALEKQIEQIKIQLYKSFFTTNKQNGIRIKLDHTKSTYSKHYQIRHSLDQFTLSGFCEKYKNDFLILHSVFTKPNNDYVLYFDKDYNPKILDSVIQEISGNMIDIPTFRKIARSNTWRSYWSANKNFLFQKPSTELTDEQRTLISFSKMYDAAYESSEPPPDPVFDDDDMFDGWILLQSEKMKQDKQKNNENNALGNKMAKSQELFIMATDKDDAQNIHNMNNSVGKSIIAERNEIISKKHNVDVTQLPDVRKEIQMKANENFKNNLRKK